MNLDKYITVILEEIRGTENYQQVEAVLIASVKQVREKEYGSVKYFTELEKSIECLSPLALNSTQFSCFRYALIFLRLLSKEEKTAGLPA